MLAILVHELKYPPVLLLMSIIKESICFFSNSFKASSTCLDASDEKLDK